MTYMGIFIEWPWLALIPGVFFLALHQLSRRRLAALVAAAWILYALYEYGMHRRWLCSGECNIRVDLLLIYPVLFIGSIVAIPVAVRGILRRRETAA